MVSVAPRALPAKGAPRRARAEPPLRLALTVPEAAAALGVSERHLRAELHRIPHLHLGRRVVLPVDALRDWLQAEARAEGSRVDRAVSEILDSVVG